MASIINEQKMVEENTFAYEDRIKAPTSRLLDTTPTFVTYYHINVDESTTDDGFADVASIVGHRSPIRYNKIENLPIYGIEQMVLQLQDGDQGLDGSIEGEAIIVPGTIKPLQNDFFIIPILSDIFMFRVTEFSFDTIVADNFYKLSYVLEYIDEDMYKTLNEQVIGNYNCILENIGTENKCIIENEVFTKKRSIDKAYQKIVDFYMSMFYDERHNVLLAPIEYGRLLYDPLQTRFINSNKLFNSKNNIEAVILTDEYNDRRKKYKYNKSIYKYIELKDEKLLSEFYYITIPGITLPGSSFAAWYDKRVDVLDISPVINYTSKHILSKEYVNKIKNGEKCDNEIAEFIRRYVSNEELTIDDIPESIEDEVMFFNKTLEVFFFIPIVLYIIRDIISNELKKNK